MENQERSMDLIRLLLIAHITGEVPPEVQQHDARTIVYHYTLLKDADFIDAVFAEGNGPIPDEVNPASIRVKWLGHEFHDASKESKLWKMAKEHFMKEGVSFTATAVLAYLKYELHKRIPSIPST